MAEEIAPDWILQQALAAQRIANMTWASGKPELDDGGLTLTVLGCGTMGIAILGGIMSSVHHQNQETSPQESSSLASTSLVDSMPTRIPSKFNACVRSRESAKKVQAELGKHNARLRVSENGNLQAVKESDIILLCCKPQYVSDLLQAEGIREALAGKLLISVCVGVSEEQISNVLYEGLPGDVAKCTIVRALPNTAAAVRESMTVISNPLLPLPIEVARMVTWIFTRIGRVTYLPASAMDACAALCGSGPAFVALIVESLAAGAIALGLPREEAYTMAAQTVRGTTGLLLQGEHPAILRDKVSTPAGCTVAGLQILEEGMVRGTVAKAVREAAIVASQLGKCKQDEDSNRARA